METNKKVVDLLREAARVLSTERNNIDICIPLKMEKSEAEYPLGMQSGYYPVIEVSNAIKFLADMIEE